MSNNLGRLGNRGFSLVELSVVITIISITLAGAIDLAINATEAQKVKTTNANMDAIETALQLFILKNQRLPCPSDPRALQANAGTEVPPTAAGCSAAANLLVSGRIYEGMVPTKTLGLADTYMVDGWNRRFTYAVDMRFANSSTTTTSCSSTTGSQLCFKNTTVPQSTDTTAIQIQTATTGGAVIATNAVYALVSNGKNGFGAWQYAGTGVATGNQLPSSTDTDELNNAATSSATLNNIFIQKDSTTTFDDMVRYATKAALINGVNGETDPTSCLQATDAVNNNNPAATPIAGTPGIANSAYPSDPCTGLTGPSTTPSTPLNICYALATQTFNFCLQP
jgi:prepilin-type N-terminal cleavage/methylation domain-containing protein